MRNGKRLQKAVQELTKTLPSGISEKDVVRYLVDAVAGSLAAQFEALAAVYFCTHTREKALAKLFAPSAENKLPAISSIANVFVEESLAAHTPEPQAYPVRAVFQAVRPLFSGFLETACTRSLTFESGSGMLADLLAPRFSEVSETVHSFQSGLQEGYALFVFERLTDLLQLYMLCTQPVARWISFCQTSRTSPAYNEMIASAMEAAVMGENERGLCEYALDQLQCQLHGSSRDELVTCLRRLSRQLFRRCTPLLTCYAEEEFGGLDYEGLLLVHLEPAPKRADTILGDMDLLEASFHLH